MSEPKDVSIVVVGLNAREFVRECFESIQAARWDGVSYEIVYIDNGSSDGSAAMVAERFPSATLIANERNLGFCRAANQGARAARGRYYYFLNDDTLVLDDAIALLVRFMDAHPDVGTVGSRLVYPDGREQWSGRRFPSMMNAILGRRSVLSRVFPNARWLRDYLCKDQLAGDAAFPVDWVSAAGQIVRKDTFDALGGYAEDYYYWHEAVFCDRIRNRGQRVLLHPKSRIVHYEGKGSGPRPFKVQRFHIVDFHYGAYRCYCEHHRLGFAHPRRWMAGALLAGRAGMLLTASAAKAGLRSVRTAFAGDAELQRG